MWQEWQETAEGLHKEFVFSDFQEAFSFMRLVADKAEELNHHPRWMNEWNKVTFWLYTHSEQAITDKDRALAEQIDATAARFTTGKQN